VLPRICRCFSDVREMKRTPRPQCFKNWAKSLAVRTYLIFDLKGRLLLYISDHEAISFEFAQLLSQNLGCHSWHGSPKLAKTE
jgi:hypothetical protein